MPFKRALEGKTVTIKRALKGKSVGLSIGMLSGVNMPFRLSEVILSQLILLKIIL
jgi:hypothetical protein